ncbi:immunity 49 family protein [Streptomyces sp. NPDC050516]|uniref:immunity 49 family protein n=1 Tax=Streptomyces sp. NPDC050516 TaxID=3365621 RepID=UPI0037ABD88D
MTSQHMHESGPNASGEGDESVEELLRGAHVRLLALDSLTPEIAGALQYARVVAEGLVFAYALDRPTSVRILTDRDVERVDIEALGAAAYGNLMRVPVEHDEVPVEGGVRLHTVYGDSHFVASQALYLSEAVRQITGEPLPDEGALVVVPSRHNFVYYPITDGSVVDGLNSLAAYALGAYEDGGKTALSPRVYWWHRGRLTSLTAIDPDTRTFSFDLPPRLLALMKSLTRLDRAGRLPTRMAPQAPQNGELAHFAAELIDGLAQDSARLGEAFSAAVTLAHARCADDPQAAHVDTWYAWATAVQLGCARFTGAEPQECHLGEDLVASLPALDAEPPADARGWLDALYLAVVCRKMDRIRRLCDVPLERLREDDSVDAYVLHWIDTLQTYLSNGPMDDTVQALTATMKASMPDVVTHAPMDFMNQIDYQPVALFHRLITADHTGFAATLTEALKDHADFWGTSTAPRARVALGPLAMASLAFDWDIPFDRQQAHLPTYLLNRERIEDI